MAFDEAHRSFADQIMTNSTVAAAIEAARATGDIPGFAEVRREYRAAAGLGPLIIDADTPVRESVDQAVDAARARSLSDWDALRDGLFDAPVGRPGVDENGQPHPDEAWF